MSRPFWMYEVPPEDEKIIIITGIGFLVLIILTIGALVWRLSR